MSAVKITAEKRRKRIRRIIVYVVVIIFVLGAGLYLYMDNQRQLDNTYMNVANEYASLLKTNGEMLKSIGEKTKAEWYVFLYENNDIYPTLKNMVDEVQFYYRSDIDKITAANATMKKNYLKLQKPPTSAEKYQKILKAAEALHASYEVYFSTVMHYSGTYASFSEHFPAAAGEFETQYQAFESQLAG